jgi:hypothetical protein
MEYSIIPLLFIMSVDAGTASDTSRESPALPLVEGKGYQGVIFPTPPFGPKGYGGDGEWGPTAEDVSKMEALLTVAAKRPLRSRGRVQTVARNGSDSTGTFCHYFEPAERNRIFRKIFDQLPTYRRQYAGIMTGSRRTIVVNFFRTGTDRIDDWHRDWRKQWVYVWGGGSSYWQILFDIQEECFHDMNVNSPR